MINWRLNGHEIRIKTVEYLGVLLDKGLTGTVHVNHIVLKGSQTVVRLYRLMPQTGVRTKASVACLLTRKALRCTGMATVCIKD